MFPAASIQMIINHHMFLIALGFSVIQFFCYTIILYKIHGNASP